MIHKRIPILFILLMFIISQAHSQNKEMDSLQIQNVISARDTNSVNLLISLSKSKLGVSFDDALSYAMEAKDIAVSIDFRKGEALALKYIGMPYYFQSKFIETLDYWQQSLEVFEELGDIKGVANMYSNIGAIYLNQGNDTKAIEVLLKALPAAEEIGDSIRIATVLNNLGGVYFSKEATKDKSLNYYLRAYEISRKLDNKEAIGTSVVNAGRFYMDNHIADSALFYFNIALDVFTQAETGNVSYVLLSIGETYALNKDFSQSKKYLTDALKLARNSKSGIDITRALFALGDIEKEMRNYNTAISYYKQSEVHAKEIDLIYELSHTYEALALSYAKISNYAKAYHYEKLFLDIKDTIYNVQADRDIGLLQFNYDLDKKQGEVDLLTKDKALQDAEFRRQKLIKNTFLGGLVLIFTIAFIIYRSYRSKVKINIILDKQATELSSINRVSEQANTSLNLNEVMQAVCDELVKIFEVRNAGIGLLDKAKTKLNIVGFSSNDPNDINPIGMELALQDYEACQIVINTKQPIAIANAQTDPRTKIIHTITHYRGTVGLLIVPILSLKEVIGTIFLPAKNPVQVFTETEIELARTIAAQVASSVKNARLHSHIEEALDIAERDLEIGHQIQSGFLPKDMPKIPDWEVASYFLAARQVAGDFFDAFQLGEDNKIGIVVADVCDKGVGAALFMVVFRSLIRAFSEDRQFNDDSKEILLGIIETVNKYITTTHGSSGMFATVFFGVLDPKKNTLFYVNAGHEMPIVIDKNGNLKKLLEPTGPAIGLMANLTFAVDEVLFEKGDILVAYTDGVVDARNTSGVSFSEETLISQIKKPYPSAFSLLKNIENQLAVHVADTDQFDDITMLALRHKVDANDERHETSQLAILDNLTNFKGFIDQAGRHMELQEDVIIAFKLAVEEACMNIITHGYKDSDPGQIKLTFERDLKSIVLTIYDEGIPFDPEDASEADIESDWEEREIGGLGLLMIREMIDEISYESVDEKGNFLFLSKKID